MKILKYVVIALLTLGVIAPATSLFAADTGSTNKVGNADHKKTKKTTSKKNKKNDGSTDAASGATGTNTNK